MDLSATVLAARRPEDRYFCFEQPDRDGFAIAALGAVETARVASASPPEHFESAIERAVERIAAGELRKVVLAREVRVHAPSAIDPAVVFDGLRQGFPSCFCYLVGTPELAFVGASPEL